MENIQDIVNKYFDKNPIDINQIKINFKSRNKFKILDDTTKETHDLGVDSGKLYIEQN